MAKSKLRLTALPPDATALRAEIARFGKQDGIVTAFEDGRLAVLNELRPDDDKLEVLPFGDVLGRFCVEVGVGAMGLPTRGQMRAAVALACEELSEEGPFGRSRAFPGFHEAIVEVLRELRHAGWTPDTLEQATDHAPEPLRSKLVDLVRVDRDVDACLDRMGRRRATERMKALLGGNLEREPMTQRLMVVAGADPRPLDLMTLSRLSQLGVHVEVVVEAAPGAFGGAHQVAALLGKSLPAPESRWTDALFGEGSPSAGPKLAIFSAADPLAECEWALRHCAERVTEGALDHRIVLVAPDTETYVPMLMSTGQRFQLNVDARVRVPLLTNGFAALILNILEALAQPHPRGLERVAKSTYFGVSGSARRALEQALVAGNSDPWGALREFAELQEEELPWLWPLLLWRDRALAAERTLSDWHHMLDELLRLNILETAAQDVESRKVEHDRRAQTALLRALADYAPVYDAVRGSTMHLQRFVRKATELWREEEIVLPSAKRGIRVVGSPQEIGEADVVVALGMLEGAMPRRRSENPILSDEDRAELARLAPEMPPLQDSFFEARAQRDEFLRICCGAKRELVLMYPQTDDESENVRASYLDDVKRVTAGPIVERDYERRLITPDPKDCRLPVDLKLAEALAQPVRELPFVQLSDPRAKAAIQPDLEAGIAPGELASALRCPFQAAARYRLGLRAAHRGLERELHQLPKKAGLPARETDSEARLALSAALHQLVDEQTGRREPWELALLQANAPRLIQGWVAREFRARQMWARHPISGATQLSHEELRDTFTVDDRKIRFVGEVDGIAEVGPYRTLQFFRPTNTDKESLTKEDEDSLPEWLVYFSAATKAKKPVALEVDGSNGERVLLVLERLEHGDGLRADTSNGLKVQGLEMPPQAMADQFRNLLRKALAVFDAANMSARPGSYCERCDFGELCRVSSALVDLDDLFAGGDDEL